MTRLLILLAILGLPQDKAFPRKAKLEKVKIKKPLLWNWILPEETKPAEAMETRVATIGKVEVLLVDVDGNGRFDDAGIDGWTRPGQRYMVPIEEVIVLGTDEASLKFDGATVHYRLDPIKAKKEYLDALLRLNELRLRNGLEPATFDPKLSDGCEKHSAYMAKHGLGHEEDASQPGYTPEGAAAGKASCVNTGGSLESVNAFYDTFYHRLPLMHPGTTAFGIGSTGEYTSIDGMRARKARPWKEPVVCPAPDSENHPTSFNATGENPQPFADGANPGCPVTVEFGWGKKPVLVSAEIREGGPRGRLLDLLVSTPSKPANSQIADNSDTICLMTKKPLRAKCAYRVKVSYKLDDTAHDLEWEFATK